MINISRQLSRLGTSILSPSKISPFISRTHYNFAGKYLYIQKRSSLFLILQTLLPKEPSLSSPKKKENGLNSIKPLPTLRPIKSQFKSKLQLQVSSQNCLQVQVIQYKLERIFLESMLMLQNLLDLLNLKKKKKLLKLSILQNLSKLLKKHQSKLHQKLINLSKLLPLPLLQFHLERERRRENQCQDSDKELPKDSKILRIHTPY